MSHSSCSHSRSCANLVPNEMEKQKENNYFIKFSRRRTGKWIIFSLVVYFGLKISSYDLSHYYSRSFENQCSTRSRSLIEISSLLQSNENDPSILLGERTLGVDYGKKRVGVAISAGYAPRPIKIIQNEGNDSQIVEEIVEIANAEQVKSFVVGIPLNRDGGETNQSFVNRNFSQALSNKVSPKRRVYVWNEAYSSVAAESRLIHKSQAEIEACLDAVAACMILEHYFEEDGWGAEIISPEKIPIQSVSDPAERIKALVDPYHNGDKAAQAEVKPKLSASAAYEAWKAAALKRSEENSGSSSSQKKKKKKKRKK